MCVCLSPNWLILLRFPAQIFECICHLLIRIYVPSIFILLYLNRPDGLCDYQFLLQDSARQDKPFARNIGSIRNFSNVEHYHYMEGTNMITAA